MPSSTGSPSEEHQRKAFEMLGDRARNAHQHGDGLTVANLAETALQEWKGLIESKQSCLSLREIQWAVIFQLHWLVSQESGGETGRLLETLLPKDDDDKKVLEALRCYHHLIQYPLDSCEKTLKRVEDLSVDCFGTTPQVETVELVRHLIELVWFRSPTSSCWRRLLHHWIGKEWIAEALSGYEKRLLAQIRLTSPDKSYLRFDESDSSALKEQSPFAELWLLHLLGRRKAITSKVLDLSYTNGSNAYEWRQIADYLRINQGLGRPEVKNSIPQARVEEVSSPSGVVNKALVTIEPPSAEEPTPTEDSISVWLSRRRSMSADSRMLAFIDCREKWIKLRLLELFRNRSQGYGETLRSEIWVLAMLHELAALRLWDFGMWHEATSAQGECQLDASHRDGDDDGRSVRAVQGLSLILRALALNEVKGDWLVNHALQTLEFSREDVRCFLFDAVMQTYPRQQYQASGVLERVADFIPASQWDSLATWTMEFAAHCRGDLMSGWKLNTLEHWIPLLPSVSERSKIWEILRPEVERLAGLTHSWRGGDLKDLLEAWLVWAPLKEAHLISKIIIKAKTEGPGDRVARAQLAATVEEIRPDLATHFSIPLLKNSKDFLERKILAPGANSRSGQAELKTAVSAEIRKALKKALPENAGQGLSLGPFPAGIAEVEHWTNEDQPLLDELVQAAESPNVHREWLVWIIYTIQIIVANGVSKLIHAIRPALFRWADSPSEGQEDPHSIFPRQNRGEVRLSIGWLAFQVLRRQGRVGHAPFLRWVKTALRFSDPSPLSIALYGTVIVAAQSVRRRQEIALLNVESMMYRLISSVDSDQSASKALAGGIRYFGSILRKPSSEHLDWNSKTGAPALASLLELIGSVAPQITKAKSGPVRAEFAQLLWNLKQWHHPLEASLLAAYEALCTDCRASVRLAAMGGWESERKRRDQANNE